MSEVNADDGLGVSGAREARPSDYRERLFESKWTLGTAGTP
jgi:hypothetical protein